MSFTPFSKLFHTRNKKDVVVRNFSGNLTTGLIWIVVNGSFWFLIYHILTP